MFEVIFMTVCVIMCGVNVGTSIATTNWFAAFGWATSFFWGCAHLTTVIAKYQG